jgi:hypothetical protein
MKKTLRLALILVLAVIGLNAHAGTINFGDLGLKNSVQYTEPFDGIDFTVTFAGGGNDGKYYNSGSGIRVYGGGTMTVAAKSGSITQIVVTYDGTYKPGKDEDVVDGGTYDYNTGTWTGEATSVVFTRPSGSGHWRIQKLEVTVSGSTIVIVPAPTITGTTPFTESTEVTLTVPEGGSTKYTTDGTDPANGTEYSAPFTITETTTVKAISYDKDGNASAVSSKSFEKRETVTLPYSEVFKGVGIGKFTTENVTLSEGMTYVWTYVSSYGMKASAYVSGACKASEAWLISPLINLSSTSAPTLSFDQVINNFGSVDLAKANTSVWVREGDSGTWTELTDITYPKEESFTFENAGNISLAAYKDKIIQIGFKYTSTTDCAGTWEIQNFTVVDGQPANLSWSKATWTVISGDPDITYPTLSNPNNLDVTYSSSNTDVATINSNGEITLVAAGETTITATFEGNSSYTAGEASYKLTVHDGLAKGGKFNPYTVSEIQALSSEEFPTDKVWVKGFIAGCAVDKGAGLAEENVATNIALSESGTVTSYIPVELPKGTVRTDVNLVDNADNLGKEIKVYGTVKTYFNVTGIKNTSSYEFTGESTTITDATGINNVTTDANENAAIYNVAGQRVNKAVKGVYIQNGKKFVVK